MVKADFEKRRAMARKLLRLDPLGLRHKLPRSWFVALHAAGRRVAYRFMAVRAGRRQLGHHRDEFFITEDIDPSTLVLLAIARSPCFGGGSSTWLSCVLLSTTTTRCSRS